MTGVLFAESLHGYHDYLRKLYEWKGKYSKKLYDMGAEDNSLINVLLSVLGFPIISLCIMQSSINNLIDRSY